MSTIMTRGEEITNNFFICGKYGIIISIKDDNESISFVAKEIIEGCIKKVIMRVDGVRWHILRVEVAPMSRVQDVESIEGVDFSIFIWNWLQIQGTKKPFPFFFFFSVLSHLCQLWCLVGPIRGVGFIWMVAISTCSLGPIRGVGGLVAKKKIRVEVVGWSV